MHAKKVVLADFVNVLVVIGRHRADFVNVLLSIVGTDQRDRSRPFGFKSISFHSVRARPIDGTSVGKVRGRCEGQKYSVYNIQLFSFR